MEICDKIIPIEIIEIIISKILDTETFKNARLVCKKLYFICSPLKTFSNRKLESITYFKDNSIKVFDNNNNLITEFNYNKYGDSILKKYNSRGTLIHTMELIYPYTIVKKDIKYNIVHKTIISIKDDTIEKETINLYGYGGCIIS